MTGNSTQPPRLGRVISIGMQKGGVSKTTNACHLAVALGERGRRILLWDVDENYGATKVFGIPPSAFCTTMNVLTGDSTAEEAILSFDADDIDIELPRNVDLIPSSRALQSVETSLSTLDTFYNPNECLYTPIEELKALGRYDYILIDTGPQASPTTRSAYLVSEYFILSLVPEKLAVDSLPDALQDIANARRPGRNPSLHLLGLILSCMDRRVTLAKRYEDAITQRFRQANEEPVKFTTTIGRAAAINRAAHEGKTILQTEPNHRVSHQYRQLAPGDRGPNHGPPHGSERPALADTYRRFAALERPCVNHRRTYPTSRSTSSMTSDSLTPSRAPPVQLRRIRTRPSRLSP